AAALPIALSPSCAETAPPAPAGTCKSTASDRPPGTLSGLLHPSLASATESPHSGSSRCPASHPPADALAAFPSPPSTHSRHPHPAHAWLAASTRSSRT